MAGVERVYFFCRGPLASSSLEELVSGARPMKIVGECRVRTVSNVFVLFHSMLWKAKLHLSALGEGLDSSHINVSFSMGSIASCDVMKTPSCIIPLQPDRFFLSCHRLPLRWFSCFCRLSVAIGMVLKTFCTRYNRLTHPPAPAGKGGLPSVKELGSA